MNVKAQNYLTNIREDMTVVDKNNDKIGKVETVYFGDEDPTKPGAETSTRNADTMKEGTWVTEIAEALYGNDRMPEELRARFARYGYIKIDRGLFSGDRYAVLDSVTAVSDDTVHLDIDKDELLSS
ncbi:MAG: hypothetical protein RLP44_20710 [Aggregatilineales bacterium]